MSSAPPSSGAVARRPNLVYILADDMGIGDASCFNPASAWKTPRLDQMAEEGRCFTDAHSASAVCTPSRYALLTGRYPWRTPLKRGVLRGYSPPLIEPGRLTVARLLQTHGYHTSLFGKWHLGLDWVRTGAAPEDVDFSRPFGGGPLTHGFDRFKGISASLDMPPYVHLEDDHVMRVPTGMIGDSPPPKLWRAGAISDDFDHEDIMPWLGDLTLQTIAEHAAAPERRPFFVYLALASPHTPIVPTPEFQGRSGATAYGDFTLQVDDLVGRILDAVDQHGLGQETLVIFTADNGFAPMADVEEHRRVGHDPSAGFRGHKADLYEGGHRVPFIARWSGTVPAGTRCATPITQGDLLATCADLLGVSLPDDAGEDSVSMMPLLLGQPGERDHGAPIVNHSENGSLAIRSGRWKLCLCPGSGGWSYPHPVHDAGLKLPPYQLFDLENDPAETENLAERHPEEVQRLGRWLRSIILNGRSTPGAPQPNASDVEWPQIDWIKDFA